MKTSKNKLIFTVFLTIVILITIFPYGRKNGKNPEVPNANVGINVSAPSGYAEVNSISAPELLKDPVITPNLIPLDCREIALGDKTKKEVAFTFDAGAGLGSIEKILDILKSRNIYASFFVTGKWAEQNPEMLKKISAAGHEIHNHTYSHPDLTKAAPEETKSQLDKTENIVKNLTGQTTKPFWRPPYGARNKVVLDAACQDGYRPVMWTVDALDWKEGTAAEVSLGRIFAKEQNGEIVLMHAGDDLVPQILPEAIKRFTDDGYQFAKLSEILSK